MAVSLAVQSRPHLRARGALAGARFFFGTRQGLSQCNALANRKKGQRAGRGLFGEGGGADCARGSRRGIRALVPAPLRNHGL